MVKVKKGYTAHYGQRYFQEGEVIPPLLLESIRKDQHWKLEEIKENVKTEEISRSGEQTIKEEQSKEEEDKQEEKKDIEEIIVNRMMTKSKAKIKEK